MSTFVDDAAPRLGAVVGVVGLVGVLGVVALSGVSDHTASLLATTTTMKFPTVQGVKTTQRTLVRAPVVSRRPGAHKVSGQPPVVGARTQGPIRAQRDGAVETSNPDVVKALEAVKAQQSSELYEAESHSPSFMAFIVGLAISALGMIGVVQFVRQQESQERYALLTVEAQPSADGWQPATKLETLKSKSNKRVKTRINGFEMIIFMEGTKVFAAQSSCPHLGISLTTADVNNGIIQCSQHKSSWKVEDGEVNEWLPGSGFNALQRLVSAPCGIQVYPTKIEDDVVFVKTDDQDIVPRQALLSDDW